MVNKEHDRLVHAAVCSCSVCLACCLLCQREESLNGDLYCYSICHVVDEKGDFIIVVLLIQIKQYCFVMLIEDPLSLT